MFTIKRIRQYKQIGYCAYHLDLDILVPSVWQKSCTDIYLELYDLEYLDIPDGTCGAYPDSDQMLINHAITNGWDICKVEVNYNLDIIEDQEK